MRHRSLTERAQNGISQLQNMPAWAIEGRIRTLAGLALEIAGLAEYACVGDRVALRSRDGREVMAEIIGFRQGLAQAAPFGDLAGLGPGCTAVLRVGRQGASHAATRLATAGSTLSVDETWLGRVVDPLGQPLGRRQLSRGLRARAVRAAPPPAAERARLGPRLDLGVRVLNSFATCRQGQRLGLFAGSGVRKSTLLSMLARHTACDVAVLALIGERGREVREFIEDDLGRDGLARSVVVVATSDAPPLTRREAAYAAVTVAEFFRDQGKSVLLLMDSVTRFCLASREIGLAAGELPATRGYPPSVFAELPRLLERAGPGPQGERSGCITAFFTVLVEGDDHNEPVADAVRGILDGHVVLDRRIAEAGRYPAVDVLRSLSRTVPACLTAEEAATMQRARGILSLRAEMADMVRLGAYRGGSDADVDQALALSPKIEQFLRQTRDERTGVEAGFAALAEALNG